MLTIFKVSTGRGVTARVFYAAHRTAAEAQALIVAAGLLKPAAVATPERPVDQTIDAITKPGRVGFNGKADGGMRDA